MATSNYENWRKKYAPKGSSLSKSNIEPAKQKNNAPSDDYAKWRERNDPTNKVTPTVTSVQNTPAIISATTPQPTQRKPIEGWQRPQDTYYKTQPVSTAPVDAIDRLMQVAASTKKPLVPGKTTLGPVSLATRVRNLYEKDVWTEKDRQEANDILDEIGAQRNIVTGEVSSSPAGRVIVNRSKAKELGLDDFVSNPARMTAFVSKANRDKNIVGKSMGIGIGNALGATSLMKTIETLAPMSEDEKTAQQAIEKSVEHATTVAPAAKTVGEIAGNVVVLLGLKNAASGVLGSATKAIPAIGKFAKTTIGSKTLGAATTALGFSMKSGLQNLGDVVTGKITAGQYAGGIATEAAAGAAGTIASNLVSTGIAKHLVNTKMMYALQEYARNVSASLAFSSTSGGVRAALSGKKFDAKQAAIDFASDFAFALVWGAFDTFKSTSQAKKAWQESLNKIQKSMESYQNADVVYRANRRPDLQRNLREDILGEIAKLRTSVSGNYYAGQQEQVNNLLENLDLLEATITAQLNTTGYLPTNEAGAGSGSTGPVAPAAPDSPDVAGALTKVINDGITQGISDAADLPNIPAAPSAPPSPSAPVSPGALNITPASTTPTQKTPAPAVPAPAGTPAPKTATPTGADTVKEFSEKLGKAGKTVFHSMYNDGDDPISYIEQMAKAYNAGQKGTVTPEEWEQVTKPSLVATGGANTEQIQAAYIAGQADAQSKLAKPAKTVQNESESVEEGKTPFLIEKAPDLQSAPQQQISDTVKKYLEKGTEFNSARLFEIADKAYGGTMAQGKYSVKDAYDGMELAVNQYLMNNRSIQDTANGSASDASRVLKQLETLLAKLPTQTKRTDEMQSYQQFSTPPNIAYLAAWAANFDSKDVVLEPSAGIGGLALWPKAWGATVYGNELSERRLAFLDKLGLDGTFNLNAEQINNLLPDEIKPTAVIMNPPFSATAGRLATNSTANAKRHIEQALDRLEDGGRLVAILGKGMSDDAPAFRNWWNDLRSEYSIRANLRIDGENYKKYGTTWDVQLVVIDKTGPQTVKTITGEYKDLAETLNVLEGIRNDRERIDTGSQKIDRPVRQQRVEHGADTGVYADRGNGSGVSERTDSGNDGQRVPKSAAGGRGDWGAVGKRDTGTGDQESVQGVLSGSKQTEVQRGKSAGKGGAPSGGSASGIKLERSDLKQKAPVEESADSVYATYTPQKARVKGAKKHPAKLVESAAMAAVEPPDVTYTPNLPAEIIKNGVLSDAQLENVIYAGQAHEQTMQNGQRKGFFIGDGTGVGKGRQIAGIIMDNFRQGRKKAVWISEKSALINDAMRDWKALGGKDSDVIDLKKIKYKTGGKIENSSGILFSSYDTLKTDKDARLKLLESWLGKDFDGVIALDEAHNMGNANGKKGVRGVTKPSAKALAGIDLQNYFPNARVVYASATGATEASNYAYLQRLGLWGPGTAFHDFNDFMTKISSGGLPAMELVARDMKAMGEYMARSISYDDVKYDTLQHDLTPVQTEIYNTMSKAWQKVLQNVEKALEITGQQHDGMARGRAMSQIFGTQQRFYNQILTSMSMPSVIADMKKELAAERSCVLQLVNTNAAAADRAIAKNAEAGGDLDDLDLTPSDMLIEMVKKAFPIDLYEEYVDEDGRKRSRPVIDGNGNRIVDKKAVKMRDDLIADLKMMKVPDGPLEMLFDAFGEENVAEVTGRTRRVVEKLDEKGVRKRVVERRSNNSGVADANAFQDGKKRILVFSDAGGTGRSYHADLTAKNQQQRVHYLLQPGWEASKAVQGFGRTHRSNQANAPIFRLVTTNVMGQKRFTSTIARRLDQLGALTKGQRQAGSGVFGEKDNLENPIAMDALSRYYRSVNPELLKRLGLYEKIYDEWGRFNEKSETLRDIGKFLNRILSLEVDEQNEVFQGFYDTFDRFMDVAIENGTVDMGLENYKADKIEVIDEKVVRKDKTGANTTYVQMQVSRKPIITDYAHVQDNHPNFQGIVRLEDGSVRAVYEISSKTNDRTGEIQRRYKLESPVRGKFSTYIEETMKTQTKPVDKKEWKAAWNEEISKAPEYDTSTLHLLTGTLLPIWDRLPQDNTRVMRVVSSDGRQYLGRVIRPDQIDGVLRGLGANRTLKQYSGKEISDTVLKGKEAIFRDGRMKLKRSRVSGDWRLELTGPNVYFTARQYPGIFSERINYDTRFFVPTGEAGEAILDRIIANNPVLDIKNVASEEIQQSREAKRTTNNNPVIFADTSLLDAHALDDKTRARTDFINHAHANFPKTVFNENTKREIGIPRNGLDKFLSGNISFEKYLSGFYIPDLIRTSRLVASADNTHKDKARSIPTFDYYEALIRIGKTNYTAHIRVKNTNMGDKYYGHTISTFEDIEIEPSARVAEENTPAKPVNAFDDSKSIIRDGAIKSNSQNSSNQIPPHPEQWTTQRIKNGKVTEARPLSELLAKMKHDFGLNITFGHVRGSGVRGTFNHRDKGLRSKLENDLPTISHELGHWLDDRFGITETDLPDAVKEEFKDALGLGKAEYPQKKWVTEGLAEFVRQYLKNRDTASIDFEAATKYFLGMMDAKSLALFQNFADEINAVYALDADTATSSVVSKEKGTPDFRTPAEKAQDAYNRFRMDYIDTNDPIRRLDRITGGNAYIYATNAAHSSAIAERLLKSDLVDLDGQYVGPGLKSALQGVNTHSKKEWQDFNEYLVMLHGPERLAAGKRVFANDAKNNAAFMDRRRVALEKQYPAFRGAAARLIRFENDLVYTWGVKTGLISEDLFRTWKKIYKHHVPLNRVIAKGSFSTKQKRGFANQSSPLRRAKGSGLDIYYPVENIMDEVAMLVHAGLHNNVYRIVCDEATSNNLEAILMEKIATPMKPHKFNVSGLKTQIKNEVYEGTMRGEISDESAEGINKVLENIADVMTQYERGKAGGDIVTVMRDGTPEFWKVNDPILLESLTNMTAPKISGVMKFFAVTTRFLQSNITGRDVIWGIFSNAPRDIMTLMHYTQFKDRPLQLLKAIGSTYVNAFREMYLDGRNVDPLYLEYLSLGGKHAGKYTADSDFYKSARRSFTQTNTQRVLNAINPINAVGFVSDTIEMGPRFATYKLLRQQGVSQQKAFYEAMDITVNFYKGGRVSRDISKFIPYFNANVQGTDKFARYYTAEDAAGKENRTRVIRSRVLGLLASGLILGALEYIINNADDEKKKDYQQLSNYTKNSYFNIPTGDGKYFSIPKGRELDVWTSMVERAMETWIGDNKHAFDEFYEYAVDNFLPSVASDVAEIPSEIAKKGVSEGIRNKLEDAAGRLGLLGIAFNIGANRDFLGKPIESQGDRNLLPKDRYNQNSSKLAYWLGQAFGVSPKMTDYAGQQTLGFMWKYQKAAFPVDASRRDATLGVKNRYVKDNVYSQDLVNWLYDKKDQSEKDHASNKADAGKAITAKTDNAMTTFYARFNSINKGNANADSQRAARQTVLNMIDEYRTSSDAGAETRTQALVYDIVRKSGATELLPSTMQTYINAGDARCDLSDSQYVEYQTLYNGFYWTLAENALTGNLSDVEKRKYLRQIKELAKEKASDKMMRRAGVKYEGYQSKYPGVEDKDIITFEANVDIANDDKSLKQDEVVEILKVMVKDGLEYEDAYTLYHTRYESDKNNPWKRYKP